MKAQLFKFSKIFKEAIQGKEQDYTKINLNQTLTTLSYPKPQFKRILY
jgi:hypothetical protein